jgi:hypothetical protein
VQNPQNQKSVFIPPWKSKIKIPLRLSDGSRYLNVSNACRSYWLQWHISHVTYIDNYRQL